MIYFNYITNPCEPNKGRISRTIEGKHSIWDLVKSQKVDLSHPTVCFVNEKAFLRNDWTQTLADKSVVSFVTFPLGGGGKSSNPLQVVLMVALVVATVYTGGAVGAAYGTMWGAVAAAGLSVGGGILINTFVPTPKASLNGMTSSSLTQSPTYSLQA